MSQILNRALDLITAPAASPPGFAETLEGLCGEIRRDGTIRKTRARYGQPAAMVETIKAAADISDLTAHKTTLPAAQREFEKLHGAWTKLKTARPRHEYLQHVEDLAGKLAASESIEPQGETELRDAKDAEADVLKLLMQRIARQAYEDLRPYWPRFIDEAKRLQDDEIEAIRARWKRYGIPPGDSDSGAEVLRSLAEILRTLEARAARPPLAFSADSMPASPRDMAGGWLEF